jgi:cytochrome c nitrite reductase small subunit
MARFALAVLSGIAAGLGVYTFLYAQAPSYFSNNPAACANCHAMRDYFDSWQKSPHHAAAACNDCHTPHPLAAKYLAKTENGWRHSLRFTLQDYPDAIRIRAASAAIVEANCVRCHEAMGSGNCLHCHAGVAHGS